MSNSSISQIKQKTRYLLWAKAAGRCQYSGCNKPLFQDSHTQIEMNFADVAHIIGQGKNGPRSYTNSDLNESYVNNISNLILVCLEHHRLIDEKPEKFSGDILRKMKSIHENRIRLATDMTVANTSNVIIYRGRIGTFQPSISYQEAMRAMFPEYYPADHFHLELSMDGVLLQDNEPRYWEAHAQNLERQFSKKIKPLLDNNHACNHFSIFAFAPTPLLIKLGSLLPDFYPAQVYQPKREPQTWKWEQCPYGFDFIVAEPDDRHDRVALNLSLSADIDDQRIFEAMNTEKVSIWKMNITESPYPKNDHLRGKGQLILFSRYARKLLNRIKAEHGQDTTLHMFPAISAAYAVELGRIRQAKADLPFKIYDQNNKAGGFISALTIR